MDTNVIPFVPSFCLLLCFVSESSVAVKAKNYCLKHLDPCRFPRRGSFLLFQCNTFSSFLDSSVASRFPLLLAKDKTNLGEFSLTGKVFAALLFTMSINYYFGGNLMKNATKQNETYTDFKDYEENCYLFSPSISKRKSVGGKPYYVRRYFRGGKDFGKTMEQLATKQLYKNAR